MADRLIAQAIDDYLIAQSNAPRKRSGKWNASSLGKCHRRNVWNRKNEEVTNPISLHGLRTGKIGSVDHQFFQEVIQAKWPHAKVEELVKAEDCVGYADIVFSHFNEVVDIKTKGKDQFRHMKGDWHPEKDCINEVMQVMWYAINLQKDYVRIAYFCRDDWYSQEYRMKVTKFWRDKINSEFKVLDGYWSSGKLPPAEPRLYKGKECRYCQFQDKCKELENGNNG